MRATYLEICGFRSYGTQAQRMEFLAPLGVVHADNSQGKTSLAEAVEFLFTGATTRRLLLGGSPSEFQDALRNAHLTAGSPVYAELGLDDGSGAVRVLRRELTSDYRGASDCVSRLTVDGTPINTVIDAGVALSDPPLAAPVLLEHTLRYAVSAKPGDRSDYFKAVLEVGDLDIVRTEVGALLAEREAAPRHPLLVQLKNVASLPLFAAPLDLLRRTTDCLEVEAALRDACHAAVPPEDPVSGANEPLAAAVVRLRQQLQRRQRDVLPIADLITTPPVLAANENSPEGSADRLLHDLADYGQRVAAVDVATAEVLPLLQAALQVDRVTGIADEHPADCPLCLSRGSLTAARVSVIRAEVADQQQLSTASGHLQEQLRALTSRTQAIARSSTPAVPAAARWDAATRAVRLAAAVRLGAKPGELEAILDACEELAAKAKTAVSTQQRVQQNVDQIVHHVRCLQTVPDERAQAAAQAVRDLDETREAIEDLHAATMALAQPFIESVRTQLESGSDTAGWAAAAQLAAQPTEIAAALRAHAHRAAATDRLRQAAKEIDGAAQAVLDKRLLRMSMEVRRWWGLLRPDELTTFDSIIRRGTGRKYLDVTAALAPQPAAAGVVRNALAILSNSQLNALGLSAFLARCQLLATPLIVLDDPVPGSDREHRSTFASDVVASLLDAGLQVLITTHDSELARHLHISHHHRGIDEFEATLVDPRTGTQVLRTGDDFEALMLDAQSQMHSPLASNRRAAGNCLRIATERLAKHIVTAGRRRAGDASAAIADYDNKNLKDLRPLVIQYCLKPNEPGQWQKLTRLLNDADHDTLDPPLPAELKQCHAALRDLKKQHVQNDQNLMRP